MWRDENGLMEMLLSYIGEFNRFDGWSNWKPVLIDILSTHEEARRAKLMAEYNDSKHENEGDEKIIKTEVVNETVDSEVVHVIRADVVPECKQELELDDDIELIAIDSDEEETVKKVVKNRKNEKAQPFGLSNGPSIQVSTIQEFCDSFEDINDSSNDEMNGSTSENVVDKNGDEDELLIKSHYRTKFSDKRDGPFYCHVCKHGFSRIDRLQQHVALAHYPRNRRFKCSKCDQVFVKKLQYTNHVLQHKRESPFACSICDSSFTHSKFLNEHLKMRHKVKSLSV